MRKFAAIIIATTTTTNPSKYAAVMTSEYKGPVLETSVKALYLMTLVNKLAHFYLHCYY